MRLLNGNRQRTDGFPGRKKERELGRRDRIARALIGTAHVQTAGTGRLRVDDRQRNVNTVRSGIAVKKHVGNPELGHDVQRDFAVQTKDVVAAARYQRVRELMPVGNLRKRITVHGRGMGLGYPDGKQVFFTNFDVIRHVEIKRIFVAAVRADQRAVEINFTEKIRHAETEREQLVVGGEK